MACTTQGDRKEKEKSHIDTFCVWLQPVIRVLCSKTNSMLDSIIGVEQPLSAIGANTFDGSGAASMY
jgi:hypothetical protein